MKGETNFLDECGKKEPQSEVMVLDAGVAGAGGRIRPVQDIDKRVRGNGPARRKWA
jgi:hypothetical protein